MSDSMASSVRSQQVVHVHYVLEKEMLAPSFTPYSTLLLPNAFSLFIVQLMNAYRDGNVF